MITKDELFELFYIWNSELVEKMETCSHHYDIDNRNAWHLEGSVWNHTLMVTDVADYFNDEYLLYAAILHDIGKVYTRKENHEKKRVSFYGHENFSIQSAIDFMKWMKKDAFFIVTVCKIISLHMKAHKAETESELMLLCSNDLHLYELVKKFNICDGTGRISAIKIEQKF